MALTNSRSLEDPYPRPTAPNLTIIGGTDGEQEPAKHISLEDGVLTTDNGDGTTTIDFNPQISEDGEKDEKFDSNLAKHMSEDDLSSIATSLLEGIERDEQSRKDWLDTRSMGITLLGLKLEKPRSDAGASSAPLEGMSTVRHPLLLEATVSFQATARAELLPAAGPVKVRNDSPMPSKEILEAQANNPQVVSSIENKDELSQALEKDMNHYLTSTATEYVPDTDRMLFYVGFGGDGFKKVYNCPLRRRPVSESIDAENLIVSNAATDIHNCGRVTHRIMMRQSTLKRMQIIGAYRDVELNEPVAPQTNAVDKKKEEIAGIQSNMQRPEDRDYEIYETYCELDLDEYAPDDLKGKGLPLPYRVTLEKDSRKILDIRRNWDEPDEQCCAKQFFVQFPFIRGLGFYGLGYIHLLGNTTNALTAAWRESLDAGMYANFPGFLYAKGAGRQLTNQFRVPPGGGVAVDVGAQQNIRDAIMPLPYKEVGASFSAFITHIEEVGKRLASTASVNVGEGKQDAPVGTTLALIEQGSKVMDSAHKRLHAAQAQEFKLLKERFREDPESFWRHNKRPTVPWEKDQFLKAINDCELVPVADPNNPTSIHRIAKAMAIKTLQKDNPSLYDAAAVDMRIMRIVDIDPAGLFRPTPEAAPPDPKMVAIQAKAKAQEDQTQIQLLETKIKAASEAAKINDKVQDRASKEKIANMQIELQHLKLAQEQVIHAHDAQRDAAMAAHQMGLKSAETAHNLHSNALEKAQELHHSHLDAAHTRQVDQATAQHEMSGGIVRTAQEIKNEQDRHEARMRRDDEEHALKMEHAKELHAQKLEAAKQLAKVKPKAAKPAKKA